MTNAIIIPCIYFLYPETGFRSLEEVDVIFYQASLSPSPWLNVVKVAKNEPLWYGKDGEEPFNYEESDWHQRHVRFSEDTKTSDGGSKDLNSSSNGTNSSNDALGRLNSASDASPGSGLSGQTLEATPSASDPEKVEEEEEHEGAPAPLVPRLSSGSRKTAKRGRSPGRGY